MLHPVKFRFPDRYDEQRLIRDLADRYRIDKGRERIEFITFYDTFDWRLFHRSLVLYSSGKKLHLRKLSDFRILQSAPVESPPVFVSDLPDGDLRKRLAPIVKVRALGKLAGIFSRKTPYRISSRGNTPVARLVYEEYRLSRDRDSPALATCLWWIPGKGSSKSTRSLEKELEEAGFTAAGNEEIYFEALKASDRKPGDYSSKVAVPLRPDMRSDEAMKIVLRSLLRTVRVNEAHIGKDLDTEFLHDFRVAIRRTRSALGRMKKVFPSEISSRFRKDLSYVGKLSNDLRDLDVYLLSEENFKEMLPASQRADIDPLFAHLKEKRSKAFQNVMRSMDGKKYEIILSDWESYINTSHKVTPDATEAGFPILDLARNKIYRKYRRVVKDGTLILANPTDEMLHALRIHCKELRYLLEFFSSLFPGKNIRRLVGQLKKLQDMLGDFNDFSVQELYLRKVAADLPATGQQSERTVAAIGVLIETLAGKKRKVKDAFSRTFTEFASPANKRGFRDMFDRKEGASIDSRKEGIIL